MSCWPGWACLGIGLRAERLWANEFISFAISLQEHTDNISCCWQLNIRRPGAIHSWCWKQGKLLELPEIVAGVLLALCTLQHHNGPIAAQSNSYGKSSKACLCQRPCLLGHSL